MKKLLTISVCFTLLILAANLMIICVIIVIILKYSTKCIKYLEISKAPRIINISSNSGRMGGFENGMAYSASKGGIIAMTYGIARQLASKKITVNCVAPGTIESDMLNARDDETKKRLLATCFYWHWRRQKYFQEQDLLTLVGVLKPAD